MLNETIQSLRGIGKMRLDAFKKLGITTLRDLLYFAPRDYEDFSKSSLISDLRHGELAALKLTIVSEAKVLRPHKGLSMVMAQAQDESGHIQLAWYNQPYRKEQVHVGEQRVFCGRVDKMRGLKLMNPGITDELPGILPVYPLVHGLNQGAVRNAVRQAAERALFGVQEAIPEELRAQYGICGIQEAISSLHFPKGMEDVARARDRLSFEDMLYYLLAIALLKRSRQERYGIAFETKLAREAFMRALPFSLTGAQKRVIDEIEADMRSGRPMNRLVQGDVGAGKTVLAFFAMHVAVQNGYQSVLMAPTEILARQHYALLAAQYGAQAVLLHGGMRKKEKEEAYARVKNAEAKYIIGTHALLQPELQFFKLGLVVADEQHRFGVRQRAKIVNKGEAVPDVLIMSATPIPRTLAMLLYGDLSLSAVDELPPGRQPVITRVVPRNKRHDMYSFIEKQINDGRQAYVVCPLVEQSDVMDVKSAQEVYEEIKLLLPDVNIALLHGRLAAAKKQEAIAAFEKGEIGLLVSTTVVEVGVDIPNATVMAVESAERFGLAQLHQLRGRVGRGKKQSFCFLLSDTEGETAQERLKMMTKTNDGFLIAQKDLEIRGPGEFLGTKQHGMDGLFAASLASNMDVLLRAQLAADALMNDAGAHAHYPMLFARAQEIFEARMKEVANN